MTRLDPLTKRLLALLAAVALLPAVALAADGDVDTGFGGNGRTTLDLGGDDAARAAVVQPDGKLVVAGSGGAGGDFAIARFNTDGTADSSFSGDGVVLVDFGGADAATGVALLADGRIVASGYTDAGVTASDFAVAVVDAAGAPDNSFSTDGRQTVEFGDDDRAQAVAVDSAGRIVVGGWRDAGGTAQFALARLSATGLLDAGFGTAGRKEIAFTGSSHLAGLAVTAADGVVAVGNTTGGAVPKNMAIARVDANGVEDPAFSGDGRLVVDLGGDDSAQAVALRPGGSGSLVVAGYTDAADPDFALLALQANGDLDTSFSGDGRHTLSFGPVAGGDEVASALTITSTGRIAVAGRTDAGTGPDQFAVALLNPDGSPTTGFSGNGKKTVDFADADDEANAVAARGNRIYLAGSTDAADSDLAVAALEGGGPRVSVRDATISETRGSLPVTVTLSAASSVPVSVRVTTAAGTARAGDDFTPVDQVLTFAPGTTSQTLPVELIDDNSIELVETFSVLLGTPSEAGLSRAVATVRVTSDEVDRTKPVISAAKVSPKAFAAKRGARVRWQLSERASVLLTFQRARTGRASARRYEPLVGRRVAGIAGANVLALKGRIVGRRLLPGLYRVTLLATDPVGNRSKRVRANFRVKR